MMGFSFMTCVPVNSQPKLFKSRHHSSIVLSFEATKVFLLGLQPSTILGGFVTFVNVMK